MQRFDIAQFLEGLGANIDLPDAYGVIPRYKLTPDENESHSPTGKITEPNLGVNPFDLGEKLLQLV